MRDFLQAERRLAHLADARAQRADVLGAEIRVVAEGRLQLVERLGGDARVEDAVQAPERVMEALEAAHAFVDGKARAHGLIDCAETGERRDVRGHTEDYSSAESRAPMSWPTYVARATCRGARNAQSTPVLADAVSIRPMRVVCWLLLLACLAVPPVPASPRADTACLPLTVTNDDGNYIVPGARGGVVYRRVDEQELRLDFWVPSTSPQQPRGGNRSVAAPVVIVIHGGGFTAGSRVTFVGQFLEMLAAAGYPWVSIDYRLGEPSRAANAADDVEAAVAFTRCHAGELGIDPERIVLLGEDAGAGLAARIANRRPAGVVGAILIGGLYNGVPPQCRAGAREGLGPDHPPRHGSSSCMARPTRRYRFERPRHGAGRQLPTMPAASSCGWKGRATGPRTGGPCSGTTRRSVVRWLDDLAPAGRAATPFDRLRSMAPPCCPQACTSASRMRSRRADASPRTPHSGSTGPVLRTLDAWLPRDRSRPGPAVVLLHGGGWEAGDRVTYITPLFAPLAEAGLAWFSVDYRLTPAVHHPRQLDDLREAIAFIRRHARQFGIDPARVVLVGESASAQMVTLVATEDRTLAGVVSFYGVYDFVPMVTDAGPRSLAARLFGRTVLDDETGRILREYSPLHRAARGMPPILLIHGTGERLWEQGVRMAERLGTLGVPHELIRLEGAPHGMENWEGRPEWQFYKARLVSWIPAGSRPPASLMRPMPQG